MRSSAARRWQRGALLLVITLGAYLSVAHWLAAPVACPAAGIINCTAVLTGPGSVVLGVPLAAWGLLWAASGWFQDRWPAGWQSVWRISGLAGLGWAWTHEWADGHLCLWCSAIQGGILVALIASIAWRAAWPQFWQGWRTLDRPARWIGGGAGLLSAISVVGYQAWLGTDTWGVVGVLAVLWGLANGWLTALLISRTGRPRPQWPSALGTVGGTLPVTLATGLGATACASGVCAGGVSTVAAASTAGLGSVIPGLFGVFGAFAPMALQGLLAIGLLWVAGTITTRRGRILRPPSAGNPPLVRE